MKRETTMKSIKNTFGKIYQVGYCGLQNIFRYESPQFYNAGVYGWNCDIYVDYGKNIAISTGYRNMRGVQIPNEIVEKYDKVALDILKDTFGKSYEDIKTALEENKENFLNEIINL